MRRLRSGALFCSVFVALIWCFSAAQAEKSPSVYPLEKVKAGLQCYGFSCFKGSELERLEIEIIGVIHSGNRYTSTIVGRVDSPSVRRGGIMSGMSGSPVYFDGQLVGAIASAFPYAREPLCGITPAESMTRLWKLENAPGRSIPGIPRRDILAQPKPDAADQLFPIGLAINTRGISVINGVRSLLWGQWCSEILEDGGGKSPETVPGKIRPGSPIGVSLISGDLQAVAFGTVTHVEGDKLLAFGHQSFGIGKCNLPLVSSSVVSFIPNRVVSFKLSNIGEPVGTLTFDAHAGVAGDLSRTPRTIPVTLSLDGLTPEPEHFSLSVLDHEFLTGTFLSQAVTGAIERLGVPWGEINFQSRIHLELASGHTVERRVVSGSVSSVWETVRKLMDPLETVQQNPLKPVEVSSISLECSLSQEARQVTLDSARVVRESYAPGDTLTVVASFHGDRVEGFNRAFRLKLPETLPSGEYILYVMDASMWQSYQTVTHLPAHRSATFDGWIDTLNDTIAEDQIKVILMSRTRNLRMDRFTLPDIPPTLQKLAGNGAVDGAGVKSFHGLADKNFNMEYEVIGSVRNTVKIKRSQESHL